MATFMTMLGNYIKTRVNSTCEINAHECFSSVTLGSALELQITFRVATHQDKKNSLTFH